MADLIPLHGMRYNPNKVNDLRKAVCPPYDVINPQAQDRYYHNHEYNIVRVELGKDLPEDTPAHNRYTRAAAFLKDWIKQKVLLEDPEPSFYIYKLDYVLPNKVKKTLKGFFALVKLEEIGKGKIFPHEFTFPKAKEDRLRLMRACHANISPIFMLYSDPSGGIYEKLEKSADTAHPTANLVGEDGVRHSVWGVSSPDAIRATTEQMKDKPLFIADGHHRYETALNFSHEMRRRESSSDSSVPPQSYDFVLIFCSNMDDPGTTLLPIHRMILNPLPGDLKTLRKKLARSFDVHHLEFNDSNEIQVRKQMFEEMRSLGGSKTVFGLYAKGEQVYHVLKLKAAPAKVIAQSERTVESLDVSVFKKLVLEEVLGITDSAAKKEDRVRFAKDESAAIKEVNSGDAGMVFFLNATKIDQVRDIVLTGDRMPQKSTYFYPKPLTGLVMNKF